MDVQKYNILRITTQRILNHWNEEIFSSGQIVQCVNDMGSVWLARPVGTNTTPRMLPKTESRQLTDSERDYHICLNCGFAVTQCACRTGPKADLGYCPDCGHLWHQCACLKNEKDAPARAKG